MIRRRTILSSKGCAINMQRPPFQITVLRTPENQGYGGNQKLGYRYAIDTDSTSSRSCTATASMRRKNCRSCSRRWLRDEADAVFGSRMIDKKAARTAGCRSTNGSATRS